MKIALVGNQNSGKTTLFNVLTGMNAKIGNWPGVTIEKKTGIIKNTKYELTDLPGIYSLSPYSIEEEISRKFIFDENVDVIINIVDSTSIERSLYLTTQLLELDAKVIVALNMSDILEFNNLKRVLEDYGRNLVENYQRALADYDINASGELSKSVKYIINDNKRVMTCDSLCI